jgi:hypothetical protein
MSQSTGPASGTSLVSELKVVAIALAAAVALVLIGSRIDWHAAAWSTMLSYLSFPLIVGLVVGTVCGIAAHRFGSPQGKKDVLKDIVAPIAGFFSFVVALGALGLALRTIDVNVQTQREMKIVDLLSDYHKRYDMLYDKKREAKTADLQREYYIRFWELIVEEYGDWTAGYIPPGVWSAWMKQRQEEHTRNKPIGDAQGMTFRAGWEMYSEFAKGRQDEFIAFMNRVYQGDEAAYKNGPPAALPR